MTYIVIELQTNNGSTAHIVTTHATREAAESKYHTVLAAAAISNVEIHAAVVMTPDGFELMRQAYTHPAVAAEE